MAASSLLGDHTVHLPHDKVKELYIDADRLEEAMIGGGDYISIPCKTCNKMITMPWRYITGIGKGSRGKMSEYECGGCKIKKRRP